LPNRGFQRHKFRDLFYLSAAPGHPALTHYLFIIPTNIGEDNRRFHFERGQAWLYLWTWPCRSLIEFWKKEDVVRETA
jgi:hypothetical protein